MWALRDFSYRKLRRKINHDGKINAVKSSFELVTRGIVAPSVLHVLFKYGLIRPIRQQEMLQRTDNTVYLETKKSNPISGPFTTNIGEGYVLPTTGLVVTNNGYPVDESVGPAGDKHNGVIKSLVRHAFIDGPSLAADIITGDTDALRRRAKTLETICPLSYRYKNYYHWTVETLPRIRYARAWEKQTNKEVTYVVWSDAPPYVDETLELLGVPERKIERAVAPVYHASTVVVPSFPEQTASDHQWLRKSVLESIERDSKSNGDGSNVYISRSNAVERRITNEQAVIEVLSQYGFKSYVLEEQSVAENVQLFNEADAVVGAHGAGLTDLIYCDDAVVLELFGSKIKNPYEHLADTVDVDYQPLQCQPDSTDIYVEIGHLERTLENMLDL